MISVGIQADSLTAGEAINEALKQRGQTFQIGTTRYDDMAAVPAVGSLVFNCVVSMVEWHYEDSESDIMIPLITLSAINSDG